jgi:hypothetical protein
MMKWHHHHHLQQEAKVDSSSSTTSTWISITLMHPHHQYKADTTSKATISQHKGWQHIITTRGWQHITTIKMAHHHNN